MTGNSFYITTPLYYVNASPHIGHSYTNVACDAMARYKRLKGYDVYFMTGTDEHGQKVEQAAKDACMDAKVFVDGMVSKFTDLWSKLSVSYDFFIRTTDESHKKAVMKVFEVLNEKGDIYKDMYKGWYCTPCETFWPAGSEEYAAEKVCSHCNRALEDISEENYFFRMSKYQDWLMAYIKSHNDFIMPGTRRNEVIGFLESGPLQDLCVTRPKKRLSWGIEVPFSPEHVSYVWFDALINYISGCGFITDPDKFRKFWPADFHVIGKDILRPHAVYWPIMLHALGLDMPKTVFAHGWWVVKGEKMSKSKGNIIDPLDIIARFGEDPFRYFLLKEVAFGDDGTFSEDIFIRRINDDLANDLGNLLSRTLTMIDKYFDGALPGHVKDEAADEELKRCVDKVIKDMDPMMDGLKFSDILSGIIGIVNMANKFIEKEAPWTLAKEDKQDRLATCLYNLFEILKIMALLLWPFIPSSSSKMWKQMGFKDALPSVDFDGDVRWGRSKAGHRIAKGEILFPRVTVK
ncbi:MAG: methionine--tRNA ligase [Candidatus Omnitrophica bacterium CG1_02_49_10]|nr:MAG: methionine--tRNA ligase [Candidatus Omnitrophica bacterium CG1_02_49_10]